MARIVEEKHVETTYTVELSQKELNTLLHLAGRLNSTQYAEATAPYVDKERILTYEELSKVFDELYNKSDYMKL